MKVLRWVGGVLAGGIATILLVAFGARFHAGPLGPFPGGPMDGEVVKEAAVDWSFATGLGTIALQTSNPPRSRTVWVVVHEGALYVPSGMVTIKSWPHSVADDPVVLLRIGDRLYIRRAVRVTDTEELHETWDLVSRKYDVPNGSDDEHNFMFRMDPFEPLSEPDTEPDS